ncbi:MAG TPA: hypothetical protein VNN72_18225 [Polyangiaceae bacterium]|nr:hypothetical protein [Polyangiaceae bacterium]
MTYGGVWWSPRVTLAWGTVFLSIGVAVAGCKGQSTASDDDDDSGGKSGTTSVPSGTPVASNGFAQKFASSFCEAIGPCCMRGGFAYTQSTCTGAAQAYLEALVSEALRYPGVSYNEAAAGDCIAAYAAAARACTDPTLLEGDNNPCGNIFKGTIPVGGHCSQDRECIQSEDAYVQCDAGVCTSDPDGFVSVGDVHAHLGEACGASCARDGSSTSCSYMGTSANNKGCWEEDGLYCSDAGVCASVPKLGEACPDYACATDSYCGGSVCVASIASGPCPSYIECLHTSYCDSDTQMCIPLKANGAACNYDSECSSANCEGDVCREWSVARSDSCAGIFDD